MKSVIATLLTLLCVTVYAQPSGRHHHKHHQKKEQLTLEQKKVLRLKKLTLSLDLSPSQSEKMATLLDEQIAFRESVKSEVQKNRESGKKRSAQERFEAKSKFLDKQIAWQNTAKSFLNEEQYIKWKRFQERGQGKEKRGPKFDKRHRNQKD